LVAGFGASLVPVAVNVAKADDPTSTYKGKTLRILVGFSTGGGYDAYARVIARHLPRHVPGTPSVVVENMPGAGSLKAVNYLDTSAPTDGTVIATFNTGLITQALIAATRVPNDFRRMAWIGNAGEDVRVCYAWHNTGVHNLSELRVRDHFNFGATSPGTASYIETSILRELFGVKLKQVQGYAGSNDKRLAVERGELDGDCGGFTSLPSDWVANHKINIFLRLSETALPGLDMSSPYAGDVLKDPTDRKTFDFLIAPEKLGRLYVMSNKVPADRVAAMRTAFNATVADPEFLKDAERLKLLITPQTGEEVAAKIKELYDTPADVVARAKAMSGS
jgi:tripartite-type tricarboxylate transporter receptor subunit TctC